MLALDKVFKTYAKRPVSIFVSQLNIVITLEAVSSRNIATPSPKPP